MYTKVPKMMAFGALALQIHVWMISAKGIKLNDKTVSVYSLPLYNLEQNKSFSRNNSIGWMLSVLLPPVVFKTPQGGADEKKKKLNKHYSTQEQLQNWLSEYSMLQ